MPSMFFELSTVWIDLMALWQSVNYTFSWVSFTRQICLLRRYRTIYDFTYTSRWLATNKKHIQPHFDHFYCELTTQYGQKTSSWHCRPRWRRCGACPPWPRSSARPRPFLPKGPCLWIWQRRPWPSRGRLLWLESPPTLASSCSRSIQLEL